MKPITLKDELIVMLINRPVSDRELGYNDCIVSLLKKTVEPEQVSERRKLLDTLGAYNFARVSEEGLAELYVCKINGQKLHAVKLLKEILGIGLKEAKDFMDEYFQA